MVQKDPNPWGLERTTDFQVSMKTQLQGHRENVVTWRTWISLCWILWLELYPDTGPAREDTYLDICNYKDGFSLSPRFFSFLKYATKEITKLNITISVIGTHKNIRFTCQLLIGITFMCKFTFCFIKQGK